MDDMIPTFKKLYIKLNFDILPLNSLFKKIIFHVLKKQMSFFHNLYFKYSSKSSFEGYCKNVFNLKNVF